MFWSICDQLIHEGQRLDGSPFHYVYHYTPDYPSYLFGVGEYIDHSARNRPTHGMSHHNDILFGIALHDFL